MKTKYFYLLSERGITQCFLSGEIIEAFPHDMYNEDLTYAWAEGEELCKSFNNERDAIAYQQSEIVAMDESNSYAERAMRSEELYGMEGVDCDL